MERPKLTRLLSRKLGYVLMIAVFAALTLVALVGEYIESVGNGASTANTFRGEPIEVLAEVDVKQERDSKLSVRLRYDVLEDDGSIDTVISVQYVSEAVYESLQEGQTVTIEYDGDSPFNWRVPSIGNPGYEFDFTYVRMFLGGIVLSFIGLGVVTFIERL